MKANICRAYQSHNTVLGRRKGGGGQGGEKRKDKGTRTKADTELHVTQS